MTREGEAFEIDPPEPDWLEPPRQCGHAWRNNDFTCMDCVEGRIDLLDRMLSLARSALERIAELDGDCENQSFNLTRFQAAQLARRFLASSATDCVANSPETAGDRALPTLTDQGEALQLLRELRSFLFTAAPSPEVTKYTQRINDIEDHELSDYRRRSRSHYLSSTMPVSPISDADLIDESNAGYQLGLKHGKGEMAERLADAVRLLNITSAMLESAELETEELREVAAANYSPRTGSEIVIALTKAQYGAKKGYWQAKAQQRADARQSNVIIITGDEAPFRAYPGKGRR